MTAVHPEAHAATAPKALDRVALSAVDPRAMAAFLRGHVGMQVLERADGALLIGAERARGRLAVFAPAERTEPGVLARVVLRVSDLERAKEMLPAGLVVKRPAPDLAVFDGPEGLGLGLTQVLGGADYELDHVVLQVADADETGSALAELGFVPRGGALHVADKQVRLEEAPTPAGGGLLRHLGLVVESLEALEHQARRRGLDVERGDDAANRLTLVLPGPERIRLEYTEEKSG